MLVLMFGQIHSGIFATCILAIILLSSEPEVPQYAREISELHNVREGIYFALVCCIYILPFLQGPQYGTPTPHLITTKSL